MQEEFRDNTDYSTHEDAVTLALPSGYILNDYKIESVIGQGSYGITYLALDMVEGKQVVIKENFPRDSSLRNQRTHTVHASSPDTQESYDWALQRFLDEAKLLIDLSHPNIVPVLHCFQAMGTAYYVMPHIGGQELQLAAPPPAEITEKWLRPILECLLDGLSYMHEQNLLHRDLKPNNILVHEDGTPVIIDFGTARALRNTHTHTKIGTPGYTPLEQYSVNGKRGPWTDFYALGATCYHLITGELPPDVHERADEDNYLPLTERAELQQRFSRAMLHSIDVALRMNRRERWQNASEWLAAMRGLNLRSTEERDNFEPTPTQPPHHENKTSWIIGLSISAFIIIGALLLLPSSPEHPPLDSSQLAPETEQLTQEEEVRRQVEQQAQEEQARRQAEEQANRQAEEQARRRAEEYARRRENALIMLHEAAKTNNVALLKEALRNGADVHDSISHRTALFHAAEAGHIECVRLLMDVSQTTASMRCNEGKTPLYIAARYGRTECVRHMVNTPNVDVNKDDDEGKTPLYIAARYGHAECVRLLMNAPNIKVNKNDNEGNTPLYIAARYGHAECVRLLMNTSNIHVNMCNNEGQTPLYIATFYGHTECVRLLSSSPNINVHVVNSNNADVNPLFVAARLGHAECIRFLINIPNVDVNITDNERQTPLYTAARYGHAECIRELLQAPNINVNSQILSGATPLCIAAFKGHENCVTELLASPNIDITLARYGKTPLDLAIEKRQLACVYLIREYMRRKNLSNNAANSPRR